MLSEGFYWLLNMSISASVVGIIIVVIGRMKALPRRLVHFLWAILFVRMSVPVGLSSRYSLLSLISRFTTRTVLVYDSTLDLTTTNYIMAASDYFPLTYKANLIEQIFDTASIVWLVVASALLITSATLYVITKAELKGASHVRDNVYVSDKICAPAVYGVFQPKVIVPKGYEERDLHYILAHESAHIRRMDNLWRIVAVVSASVHWFNPLVWLFLKKFLEDTELACDESVLARCGEDEKKAYATALVDCIESRNVFASAFGGATIRVRIDRILSYRKLSILSVISLIVFASAVGFVLLTNAS